MSNALIMSMFVIVPGAWDTPATLEPLVEPLGSAGHAVITVDLPLVYLAAWIPRPGASVLDLFVGSDPFADGDEAAGIAAFGGLIVSAGPGLCGLNIDGYVAPLDPSVREAARSYLQRTQRPQGIAALRQKWRGELRTSGRNTYILTTADTLVPPEAQRAMAASVGATVVEIDTGHGPFREQPARLVELLAATAR